MPACAQRHRNRVIAVDGGRLVVPVRVDGLDAELAGKRGYRGTRAGMPHVDPPVHAFQGFLQFRDTVPDEGHAAIGARSQPIEDLGIEDKYAMHALVGGKRGRQGGVVVMAQVAPEPDQSLAQGITSYPGYVLFHKPRQDGRRMSTARRRQSAAGGSVTCPTRGL